MSDLVCKIQYALLGGTDDEEYVRGLLRELQIPANAPRDPNAALSLVVRRLRVGAA